MSEKKHRKVRWRMVIVLILLFVYLVTGITGCVFLKGIVDRGPVLDVTDYLSEETTKVYDANGNLVQEVGVYRRNNVSYNQCPDALIDAFLAIEDSRYFSHNGVDVPRLVKVTIDTLRSNEISGGGSTFTMQLVKNTYFTTDAGDDSTSYSRTIDYKVQQIWLALQTERVLNKKKIFELYINKLNFGNNIRGVQSAAQYYFGKDVDILSLDECILLAGIVNLPNRYNPYEYLDYATERRNTVIDQMVNHGYLNEEQAALCRSVKVEDLLAGEKEEPFLKYDRYQVYVDLALQEAQALTGMDPTMTGMEIYTALQPHVQSEIEAIQNGTAGIEFPSDTMQCAIISINNRNGEIIGVGGGRGYDTAMALNRATSQYKQPGSTVKPFLSYALAFEYLGYTLDETLEDHAIIVDDRVIQNATGTYWGTVKIKDAVAWSLNIPAILTMEAVEEKTGVPVIVQYLNDLGFDQVTEDNWYFMHAIGSDEFEVTAEQLAAAHAAMINLGTYNEPHTVRRVVTTRGKEYLSDYESRTVLSPGSCWLADQLMENNVSGGVPNGMDILERNYPVYAKTGTTDWGDAGLQYGIPEGAMKDSWMVASSSNYTNAVWLGWDKAEEGEDNYLTSEMTSLNIPGNINSLLLSFEEGISQDILDGVRRPDDVLDTDVTGEWSQISAAGAENRE